MSRMFLTIGMIPVFFTGVPQELRAHEGNRVVPIFEVTTDDLAKIDLYDGSIDDWLEILGEPPLTPVDFTTSGAAYDPADLDYRIWLAWHGATNRIYVAMELIDDEYVNVFNRGALATGNDAEDSAHHIITNNDGSVEFLIDGDHSGGQFYGYQCCGDEWLLSHQTAQEYEIISQVPAELYGNVQGFDGGRVKGVWISHSPYSEVGGATFGEAPTVSILEFYVTPFDILRWDSASIEESQISDLFVGKIVGLALGLPDFDQTFDFGFYSHKFPDRYTHSADFFADGVLVGKDGKVPEITAVDKNSWARIKASFSK